MATTDGNKQWLRYVQVVVGKGGTGLSIDTLRVKFEITKSIEPTPNPAVIKIYNLNFTHEQQIKDEFTDIIVNAGYQGNSRLIFRGSIQHVFKYREGNDWVTQIEAGDGDSDYRKSFMNVTIASGSTDTDLIAAALSSFSSTQPGVTQVNQKAYIRGRALSGMTRDMLDSCARDNSANWSIQDGRLYLIPVNGVLPGQAVVINADTGMLSAPTINSNKGIEVKCLLNPQIQVHGAIWLDNNGIKIRERKQRVFSHASAKLMPNQPNVRLDPDGIYKVFKLIHRGDTFGKEFVTDIACVGLNSPIPQQNQIPQTGVEEGVPGE